MLRQREAGNSTNTEDITTLVLTLSLIALVLLAVVALVHYAPDPNAAQPVAAIDDSAWIDSFSISKYSPLIRLTSSQDSDYVALHMGPQARRAYNKIRRGIIRNYLRSMTRDFNRIHKIAMAKALRAPGEDGHLSASLVEQQMTFIFHIWTLEACLLLNEYVRVKISLDPVLNRIEHIAADTRELMRPQLNYQVV